MATTLTSNLKLRVGSDLTADSKYNLEQIDTLGSVYSTDSSENALVRSQRNIILQPNDPDIGGSGSGGTVQVGTVDQSISNFQIYADAFNVSANIAFDDQATGGTQDLLLGYKSDINGAVDTTADRTLLIDVDGADRNLVLGGDFQLDNNLTFTSSGAASLTLPLTGTLASNDNSLTLTNKTIDAGNNTLSNIANAAVSASAAIDGTKINPDFGTQEVQSTGGFSSTASVAFVLPNADGSSGQVVSTDGSGNLSFISVATSTLAEDFMYIGNSSSQQIAVDTDAVGDILGNVTTGLTIKADVIVDADINSAAAISLSKLGGTTASRVIETNGSGDLTASAVTTTELGYVSGVTSSIQTQLDAKQAQDSDLDAIAALTGNGFYVRTGAGSAVIRSIVAGSSKITVTNGDGFTSNPSIDLGIGSFKTNWTQVDGSTKSITHSLGTQDVMVQLYDTATSRVIVPASIEMTTTNAVTIIGENLPATFDFRVLIQEIA